MMNKDNVLLPILLEGEVVHGKALGRTVGMPTANLSIAHEKLPGSGVYATRIEIEERRFDSITNIGRRPSVDQDEEITVETYIFDFDEEIYGQIVKLEVLTFLRPVMKFESLEEVHEQVEKDILEAKAYFRTNG